MGKIVAIDYGQKRIGLAYADDMLKVALPFKTVEAGKDMPKTVDLILQALNPISKEVKLFVVGLPLLMSGQEGPMAKEAKAFGKLLEQKSGINVQYFDERLTSAGIERELKHANISRKKRAKKIDPLAATRILQAFLASQTT